MLNQLNRNKSDLSLMADKLKSGSICVSKMTFETRCNSWPMQFLVSCALLPAPPQMFCYHIRLLYPRLGVVLPVLPKSVHRVVSTSRGRPRAPATSCRRSCCPASRRQTGYRERYSWSCYSWTHTSGRTRINTDSLTHSLTHSPPLEIPYTWLNLSSFIL